MSLEGTIESFGISEIFQLISQQGKTGTLEIDSAGGPSRVRFLDGKLLEAWSPNRPASELIGAMLVRSGLINPVQLDHALVEQRQSLRPLGDLLMRSGAIRSSEFQHMLALQHRETFYRLLGMRKGNFSFQDEPVEFEEGVSVLMDTGALLMEGFRQIDEWPQLREAIPSETRVLMPVREPTGELTPNEAIVLSLVDGAATVRDVVDRARLGEFEGWRALSTLLAEGTIAPVTAAARPAPLGAVRSQPVPKTLDGVLAAVMLVLALALLLGGRALDNAVHFVDGVSDARQAGADLSSRANEWRLRRPPTLPNALRAP